MRTNSILSESADSGTEFIRTEGKQANFSVNINKLNLDLNIIELKLSTINLKAQ